jgi:Domain of unknown function (DUF4129)
MLLKRTPCLLLLIGALLAGAAAQQAAPVPCPSQPCNPPSAPAQSATTSSETSLTLEQYKAELDRLTKATDLDEDDDQEFSPEQAHALNETVPPKWVVTAGDRRFEVQTVWIKLQLGNIKEGSKANGEILDSLQSRLNEMRSAANRFETSPADATAEKARLNDILARGEFNNVRQISWLDRLKSRATRWLFELLSRIFGSSAGPIVGKVLVWLIVGAALILLALMIYRVMKNNARIEGMIPKVVPVSAKPWTEWMAEARAAAARGEWREAIHLSYWAGVSLLEARGLWKPDRARTPREYLRLLASNNEFHPTLTQLTRRFEVIWYGYKSADEGAFTQALDDLEKLGCR